MKKHPNTIALHDLMREYNLKGPDVARILNRALKTVHCWRAESPSHIGDTMLELLKLKLAARAKAKE